MRRPTTARCWCLRSGRIRTGWAYLVAADPGFYSATGEATAKAGVATGTKSARLKQEQKKRWFKAQRRQTGCEGRISVLKRRNGLNRCHDRGDTGMKRWIGLGVLGDILINPGVALARSESKTE